MEVHDQKQIKIRQHFENDCADDLLDSQAVYTNMDGFSMNNHWSWSDSNPPGRAEVLQVVGGQLHAQAVSSGSLAFSRLPGRVTCHRGPYAPWQLPHCDPARGAERHHGRYQSLAEAIGRSRAANVEGNCEFFF